MSKGHNTVRLSHKNELICTPFSMGFVVDKVALGQIFHCHYHSINDSYSFIHLSLALYNLNNSQCHLGFYAASSGNPISTFRPNLSVPSSRVSVEW